MNTKKERTFFAHNIKTFRHLNKMSTAEFAALILVDGKRLAEVEKGRLLPSDEEINAFLSHFSNVTREQIENSVFELRLSEFAFKEATDLPMDAVPITEKPSTKKRVRKADNIPDLGEFAPPPITSEQKSAAHEMD